MLRGPENIIEVLALKGDVDPQARKLRQYLELLSPEQKALAASKNNKILGMASSLNCVAAVTCLLEIPEVLYGAPGKNALVLIWAIKNGHVDIVDKFLGVGGKPVDIAATWENGYALTNAAEHTTVLRRLLSHPSFATQAAIADNRVICLAAKKGNVEAVRLLLSNPQVFEAADVNHNYLFFWAVSHGHDDIVNILLSHPRVAEKAAMLKNYAIRVAAQKGFEHIVARLLDIPEVCDRVAAGEIEASEGELPDVNGLGDMLSLLSVRPAPMAGVVALGAKRRADVQPTLDDDKPMRDDSEENEQKVPERTTMKAKRRQF